MDWFDLIILILLGSSLMRGFQLGLSKQLGSTLGFFVGLFLGAYLGDKVLVKLAQTAGSRAFYSVLLTLGLALIFSTLGEYFGAILKYHLRRAKYINEFDEGLGLVLGGCTLLLGVWLAAAVFATLPNAAVQNQVHDSFIVKNLNKTLPPAPDVIGRIGRLVEPDGFPQVFTGLEPSVNTNAPLPSMGVLSTAIKNDENSVVKIEGRGCGGIVEGSGFIVGNDLVATNAHVVAGIESPIVLSSQGSEAATVVWFDPDLDFALLRVNNLVGQPLNIDTQSVSNGTDGVIMGYPDGGPFYASPAVILQEFEAEGRNIYNQTITTRNVYSVKGTVVPGNSGGPMVNQSGTVIGVIFAQSTTYNQVGYAIASTEILPEIHKDSHNTQAVSTGDCAE